MNGCNWQNKSFSVSMSSSGKRICYSCRKESSAYILGLCIDCYKKGEEGKSEGRVKYKLDFKDNPNAEQILKVGREIKKFKELDGFKPKEIQRRFGKDANALCIKKSDHSDLTRQITRDIVVGLNELKRRK
jgi:hypothetical protein